MDVDEQIAGTVVTLPDGSTLSSGGGTQTNFGMVAQVAFLERSDLLGSINILLLQDMDPSLFLAHFWWNVKWSMSRETTLLLKTNCVAQKS